MGVGGNRTIGALIVIEGLGMGAPGRRRKNRISPLLSGGFLKISYWASVLSPTQSLGTQSLNAAVKSCEAGWIPSLCTPYIQPHPAPRDKVVMKSHEALFAQHSKSGRYQEVLNRLLPTPNQSLLFMLSNRIVPSCSI